MSLRHLIIRLRVLFTTLVITVVVALIGGLIYLHEEGFSSEAGDRVAAEMERYGIYTEFDNLSFHLIRGLTANDISFYQTKKREVKIAELPSLAIHVDKTKLMRGILKINTISVSEAQLSIPLVKGRADSPNIEISDVSGSIDLPGKQSVSTTDLAGTFHGIRVSLSCNVWRDAPRDDVTADLDAEERKIASYRAFLDHLESWSWSENEPPQLKLFIEGNLSDPNKFDFDFEINAPSIDYKSYTIDDLFLSGDWNQNLITLDELSFSNQSKPCSVTADYDIDKRNGRFKIDSSIHLKNFAQQVFDKQILTHVTTAGKLDISASGDYQLPQSQDEKFSLSMIGNVTCENFSYKATSINTLTSDFSWNNGDLYLDKLKIDHPLGELSGRLIIKDRKIRYQTKASLPAKAYFPFILQQPLVDGLSKLNFTEKSYIDVTANGYINQDNLKEWEAYGDAELRNFSHREVPVSYTKTKYSMNRSEATFSDITVTFDYTDYPLRKTYNGSRSGTLTADSLYFNWTQKQTDIQKLRGTAWPAPVLRLFAPKVANHLENYKFHLPPTISTSGIVSWAKGNSNKTNLKIGFTTSGVTDYRFIGEEVALSKLKGQVTVLPDKVQVNSLSGSACGGSISGYIHVTPSSEAYSGRFQWNKLQLPEISKTYKFKKSIAGNLIGSLTFRGKGSDVTTLNGHGSLALNDGDLFGFPLFGPLSSLIDGVVKPVTKQQVLHEKARQFAASYTIKNGVIYTRDLVSATVNTTFTGEGWIDLNREILDLTIRMNFRGLMGLAEIPMKVIELPFQALNKVFTGKDIKGFRQFRGSGSINDPKWQFAPFSAPRNGKDNPIFQKPGKAIIVR